MTTQNNTITKDDLKEVMTERNKPIYWIMGAMLTIFVFFTILVLTLLFDVWGDVNTLQGIHQGVNSTHATQAGL